METIDAAGIDAMAQRFRANFINSLSGYKSANLVGTCNEQQQTFNMYKYTAFNSNCYRYD